MHPVDRQMFALKLVLACLAVFMVAAVLIRAEGRITNGLALTSAELMIDTGTSTGVPRRVIVEAR